MPIVYTPTVGEACVYRKRRPDGRNVYIHIYMILYDICISICIIYMNIMFFGRSMALGKVESNVKSCVLHCIRTISCELLTVFERRGLPEVWPIAASAAWLLLGLQGKSFDILALIVDVCTTHVYIPHKHKKDTKIHACTNLNHVFIYPCRNWRWCLWTWYCMRHSCIIHLSRGSATPMVGY